MTVALYKHVPSALLVLALIAAGAVAGGLLGLDAVVARSASPVDALDALVRFLEIVTLKRWSEFLLPLLLALAGAAIWAIGRQVLGRALIYVGVVQLSTYLASDLSKPQFGRLRPFEAAQNGGADSWFVGANSFPSGHVAFFAGLIVPMIILAPRAWPLVAIPIFVAAERVLAGDHYLSDVGASFLLALIVSWGLRRIGPRHSAPAQRSINLARLGGAARLPMCRHTSRLPPGTIRG